MPCAVRGCAAWCVSWRRVPVCGRSCGVRARSRARDYGIKCGEMQYSFMKYCFLSPAGVVIGRRSSGRVRVIRLCGIRCSRRKRHFRRRVFCRGLSEDGTGGGVCGCGGCAAAGVAVFLALVIGRLREMQTDETRVIFRAVIYGGVCCRKQKRGAGLPDPVRGVSAARGRRYIRGNIQVGGVGGGNVVFRGNQKKRVRVFWLCASAACMGVLSAFWRSGGGFSIYKEKAAFRAA